MYDPSRFRFTNILTDHRPGRAGKGLFHAEREHRRTCRVALKVLDRKMKQTRVPSSSFVREECTNCSR